MQLFKKPPYVFQILTKVLFLMTLAGCGENTNKQQIDCNITPDSCLTLENDHTKIMFNTPVVVVENTYQISVISNKKIEKLEVTGINMNMGLIPVFLSEQNIDGKYHYQGQLFLGMCSEPKMQWQLRVVYKNHTPDDFQFTGYWQAPVSKSN